jgi:peroxiredoxin
MRKSLIIIAILLCSLTAFAQQKPVAETFSAPLLDGSVFDLAEARGKIVLLTFWSTRCAICAEEIPTLNKLVENFKGHDVIFLASTNEPESRIEPFLKKKPFKFDIIPNGLGVLLKYADRDKEGRLNMGYPAYFLINQQGEIEYKSNGWDRYEKLRELIGKLSAQKTPPAADSK